MKHKCRECGIEIERAKIYCFVCTAMLDTVICRMYRIGLIDSTPSETNFDYE